jgi:hypothetical protein
MIRSALFLASALLLSGPAFAQGNSSNYEVTIYNITKGQTFTPILAVTHSPDISLFELGEPSSAELATLAERGAIAPLREVLDAATDLVAETNTNGALLFPGDHVTIEISGEIHLDRLSFAGMLVPTNDAFVAINGVELPKKSSVVYALAYDAGSEANDELCANIPGPYCGDMDDSGDTGEGFVYVGNGIRGAGDLDPAAFDWNNPVARVEIRRVN